MNDIYNQIKKLITNPKLGGVGDLLIGPLGGLRLLDLDRDRLLLLRLFDDGDLDLDLRRFVGGGDLL